MGIQASHGERPTRPPRRMTEARREQNRIASRNYRHKRKQKLALLSQLIDGDRSAPSSSLIVDDPHPALPPLGTAGPEDGSWHGFAGNGPQAPAARQAGDAIPDALFDASLIDPEWTDILSPRPPPLPSETASSSTSAQLRSVSPQSLQQRGSSHHVRALPASNFTSQAAVKPSSLSLNLAPPLSPIRAGGDDVENNQDDEDVLRILDDTRSLSEKQKRQLVRHLQGNLTQEPSTPVLSPLQPRHISPTTLPGANWASHHPRRSSARTRLQDEVRRFAHFMEQHLDGSLSPTDLSRIYVVEVGFFGAVFANCYAIGMSHVDPLMAEDGTSPFCIGPDTGYLPSQLAAVRSRFKAITPDLQPCDVQLTFGHHPYLDVLPFSTFRDNALKLLEKDEKSLDEDQLCEDLTSGGLVCWGSQQNSLGMEAGVPWDMRSWEPQVWFLRKYRHLVGGWDDEMWKCTRWWHQARGETLKLS